MWSRGMMMGVGMLLIVGAGCDTPRSASNVEPVREAGVRTGKVSNIVVSDTVSPGTLTVQAGDEVRWINQRQRPVVVEVTGPIEGKVSCANGFSKAMGMGVSNRATIDPNETAGLCFNRLGTVHYTVGSEGDDDVRPLTKTQGTVTVQ